MPRALADPELLPDPAASALQPESDIALHHVQALNDPDPQVQEDAIEALGDLRDPQGVPGLQRALYSEHNWLVRSAIEALADIGTDEAAMALGPLLSDADPELREATVDALADIGSNAARGYLDQALVDPDPEVQESARAALLELSYSNP